ncbi:MAG: GNAT family N-acetyltransferase [Lachnoclostridium sp.]|jgi:RimJ/RimL family protein N-acetyltransferase|nr:GNAT family N-acetyltransferase [Lachnoclostridium sp.]
MLEITLKLLKKTDMDEYMDKYIELQKGVVLGDVSYKDEIIRQTWPELFESDIVSYAIITKEGADFCGYCAVKNIETDRPEIQIELLRTFRGKGIGFQALYEMMVEVGERYNISCFIAAVESDNYASQRLMYKLGGLPGGIRRTIYLNENEVGSFEKDYIDLLNRHMIQVAADFGVAPQKLLSHVLIFKIQLAELKKGMCSQNPCGTIPKTALMDEQDRKVSIAMRKHKMESIANDVLDILRKLEKERSDDAKKEINEYSKEKN